MPKIKTGSRLANYTTEGNQSEATPLINAGCISLVETVQSIFYLSRLNHIQYMLDV